MAAADPAPDSPQVPGPQAARVPLVRRADAQPRAREVFDSAYQQYGGIANLYRVLANSPELLHAWAGLAWPLREQVEVSRGLRELAILRIARELRAPYVWAHHHEFAVEAGVPGPVLELIETSVPWPDFAPPYRSVVRAAEEITREATISDECFAELASELPTGQVVELLTTIAFYNAVARLTRTLQIPLERRPGWQPLPGGQD
jgi:4-carboxymuconolactone decarboxylase